MDTMWEYNVTSNATNITTVDIVEDNSGSYSMLFGTCDNWLTQMRYIVEVWICLPIACIGIVGNIMAFIVLWNHKQKLTTTIILQGLAFVDTLILIAVIPLQSLWNLYVCHEIPPNYKEPWKLIFRCVFPTVFALRMIDTWLIVLLTFDRWIAVCRPLHAPRLCTKGATYARLSILIVVALAFSLPRYFENTQYGFFDRDEDNAPTVLNDFRGYVIAYQVVLFFILMYLIPMILLVVLNVQLILALRNANASFVGRRHSQSTTSAQHRGITVIVITVVSTCVVCNILAMISHLMFSMEKIVEKEEFTNTLEAYRRPLSIINHIMIVLNSAINFALYCLSSKNFRQITYKTFCCWKSCSGYSPVGRNTSMHSSNTYDTYVSSQRQTNGAPSHENGIKLKRLLKPSQ